MSESTRGKFYNSPKDRSKSKSQHKKKSKKKVTENFDKKPIKFTKTTKKLNKNMSTNQLVGLESI